MLQDRRPGLIDALQQRFWQGRLPPSLNEVADEIDTRIGDMHGNARINGLFGNDTASEDLSPAPYMAGTTEFSPATILSPPEEPERLEKWQDSRSMVENTECRVRLQRRQFRLRMGVATMQLE